MLVEDVECGNEELVRILLLVAGEVPRVSPHQMKQSVRRVRHTRTRVKLNTHKHTQIIKH